MAQPKGRAATALIVDIRDFTPTYNALSHAGRERVWVRFIETFYAACSDCCRASWDGEPGAQLFLNCTGDGLLAVFLSARGEGRDVHALRAYLAALRMLHELPKTFRILGEKAAPIEHPRFGIGMESGSVIPVGGGTPPHRMETCLGHCINVAARLEGMTKVVASTALVMGEAVNQQLVRALHGADYDRLRSRANRAARAGTKSQVDAAFREMREANDAVGVHWLGALNLKGVDHPLLAVRTAAIRLKHESAAREAKIASCIGLRA